MQIDYAWLHAMRNIPVKPSPAEPAQKSTDAIGAGAFYGSPAMNVSPAHYEQHGSESESLTACGDTAVNFGGVDTGEVDSGAGAGVAASPLSPAAWPFVQRQCPGTPVSNPLPRRFARKSRHPQRAREAVAEEWDQGGRAAPVSQTSSLKIAGLKRKAGSDAEYHSSPLRSEFVLASTAVSAEPKFNRHGAHVCAQCGTSKTPMWRRFSNVTYCNACGLRKQRSTGGR